MTVSTGPLQLSARLEMVSGSDLADKRAEYKDLAKVDAEIPTIVLNRTYSAAQVLHPGSRRHRPHR